MKYILVVLTFLFIANISAQDGYEIKIITKNYSPDSLFISYPYAKEFLVLDTLRREKGKDFIMKSDAELPPGMYFIGTFSQRKKFPVIITPDDDHFEMKIDFANKFNIQFNGSRENDLFREYYLLSSESKKLENLYLRNRKVSKRDSVRNELNELRMQLAERNPNTVAALAIKSELEWVDPVYKGLRGNKLREKVLSFKINHYLDNVDLNNIATMRLPLTHEHIERYLDRVVHLKPDHVKIAIDSLLTNMGINSEMYKYYLPFFQRKYSFAFQKWVDEVYIHIARKYYNKEMASWISLKEIDRVQNQADRRESTLLGKMIPDVTLENEEGKKLRLLDIDAEYIVLVFWRPGCSHCRHAMPYLNKLHKRYKKNNVKIVTACTRQRSDTYRCWDGVKSEKMEDFDYNLADKSGETGFLRKFNIGGVPNSFIIDKDKKIIDKKVAPTLLMDRMERIIKGK